MKIHSLLVSLLAIAPTIANADISVAGLKDGTVNAVKAVGETTGNAIGTVGDMAGKATDAAKDTVTSTKKDLRDEATPEETRAKLDGMAEATLERLFAEHPGSRELFDGSAGYAVIDSREASFYVVAGYGRGVAVDRRDDTRTYMKMATTGAGLSFGIGGFDNQIVILFEEAGDFTNFVKSGVDATAQAGTMVGDDEEELALRFTEGKAVFVLTKKGWKVAAKLTGSRYWPDDELNAR